MVSLPGDASHTALLKSHCRGRQCSLFCLCAPFPREYTVSRGDPDLAMPRNDILCVARNLLFVQKNHTYDEIILSLKTARI